MTIAPTISISDGPGAHHTTSIGIAQMFGARAEYDTIQDRRLNRIVADKKVVAFRVEHTHEEPHHAYMLTPKVHAEKEPDGADQGITSYNGMLAEMGYAPGHHDVNTKEGDAIYYNGHAKIVTVGMNTNAAAFEPSGRWDDCVGDDEDAEEEVTTLATQHDDRVISFIADSGAPSYNLQDIKAFGLERSETNTTGYIAIPPTGAIGSPRAIIDGGGKRHTVEYAGSPKATTEDGQSMGRHSGHGERSKI